MGGEHQQVHNRVGVRGFSIAQNEDLRRQGHGKARQLGRGARMQSLAVHNLNTALDQAFPVSAHAVLSMTSEAMRI